MLSACDASGFHLVKKKSRSCRACNRKVSNASQLPLVISHHSAETCIATYSAAMCSISASSCLAVGFPPRSVACRALAMVGSPDETLRVYRYDRRPWTLQPWGVMRKRRRKSPDDRVLELAAKNFHHSRERLGNLR